MAGAIALLVSYLIGGITLLPLLLLLAACHAYITLPTRESPRRHSSSSSSSSSTESVPEALKDASEPSVAAGHFAVCREYVPGGVNGKPPERATPAGAVMTAESPSVYQTMWKGIFDRGKTQTPSVDPATAKQAKKSPRNVFYVVLRHGHLVLFDNAEQVEIRHVISLEHHAVDIYGGGGGGGDPIPEGELWIKRNCIRLSKRAGENDDSPPYYFFCENCSEKEDFYHAIVKSQQAYSPLGFPTDDMIKLIRQLHASEENAHTRWLNALLGRLFLALYRTADIERHLRQKISKKISRVAKPAFISDLRLEDIQLGDSGPFFFNPKLREMTVDGTLTLETDVRYMGNFRAVIAAVARIDLGSRFKAREVDMILAGILKRLEGHLLVKIKPPPSNRIWISFETLPKLDISLEPIVSSRQITYGVILRAMQSRIREVFAETLVSPNWDDLPFTNTEGDAARGGIWTDSSEGGAASPGETLTKEGEAVAETMTSRVSSGEQDTLTLTPPASPLLHPAAPPAESREDASNAKAKAVRSPLLNPATPADSREDGSNAKPKAMRSPLLNPAESREDASNRAREDASSAKPKAMRSNSFAAAADPVVSHSPTMTESVRRPARSGQRDATSVVRNLSKQSPEVSPTIRPATRRDEGAFGDLPALHVDAAPDDGANNMTSTDAPLRMRTRGVSMTEPAATPTKASEKAKALNQSLTAATAAAKTWGWGMLSRQNERLPEKSLSEPMGRGQPLPPPGVPLPRPERPNNWTVAALGLRRKPVGGGSSRATATASGRDGSDGEKVERRVASEHVEVLTVEAPADTAAEMTADDEALPDYELGVVQHDVAVTPVGGSGRVQHHRRSVSHDAAFMGGTL